MSNHLDLNIAGRPLRIQCSDNNKNVVVVVVVVVGIVVGIN